MADLTMWAKGSLWKTFVTCYNTDFKPHRGKMKPYVNIVQRVAPTSLGSEASGMDHYTWKHVFWSDQSVFKMFFGGNGDRLFETENNKDHQHCYQQQVEMPVSVMA